MKTATIYKDEGVNAFTLGAMINMLQSFGFDCDCVSAQDIFSGALTDKTALFVMPGGADEPYHAKLGDEGADIIRKYVAAGGTYFGSCAGAYYACDYFEFNKGFESEICRERPLKLFKGWARGSLLEFAKAYDTSLDTAAVVELVDHDSDQILTSYYHGGPVFMGLEKDEGVKVLASYKDLPANQNVAVITKPYEKGLVILSAPHIEVEVEDAKLRIAQESDPQKYDNILNGLEELATERHMFLEKLLGLLPTRF